jgi:phage tail-like protein
MAEPRENPYSAFNFHVLLDGINDASELIGGFQEASGLSIEVTMQDYRTGNEKTNFPRKISGLYSVGDITLRRGLVGKLDLYNWINETRTGSQLGRTVTITQYDETHQIVVMTYRLTNARPMRLNGPSFNAKSSSEIAMEELVLSVENLEWE